MRFRRNKRLKNKSIIDITPLVNVVFLLLVFLLLAMGVPLGFKQNTMIGQREIPAISSMVVVVLPGKVVIDGKTVSDKILQGLPRNRDIVILASKEIPYSQVISILDVLRISGHTRLSLATKPVSN
jgi:biopolymer transport protein ExbD